MLPQIGYEMGPQRGAAVRGGSLMPCSYHNGRVSAFVSLETNLGNLFLQDILDLIREDLIMGSGSDTRFQDVGAGDLLTSHWLFRHFDDQVLRVGHRPTILT